MSKKVNKYKKAGVNINEGNKFVKLIKKKYFLHIIKVQLKTWARLRVFLIYQY